MLRMGIYAPLVMVLPTRMWGVVVAELFHFTEEVEGVFDGLQRLEVDDVSDVDGEVHRDDSAAVGRHDDVLLVDADTGGDFLVLV